jgi:hypothetical protein
VRADQERLVKRALPDPVAQPRERGVVPVGESGLQPCGLGPGERGEWRGRGDGRGDRLLREDEPALAQQAGGQLGRDPRRRREHVPVDRPGQILDARVGGYVHDRPAAFLQRIHTGDELDGRGAEQGGQMRGHRDVTEPDQREPGRRTFVLHCTTSDISNMYPLIRTKA